jgi:hypothetical protein
MADTPPEITDEHVALLADLHAVITQAMTRTPYVLGQPVDDYAAIITADVAAYMGKQVAGVAAELDAASLRQRLATAEAENTPLPLVPLREAVITAIAEDALRPHLDRLGLVDAMIAVVWPQLDAARRSARASEESTTILQRQIDAEAAELDAARAENDRLRQQQANARNAALTEAGALLLHKRAFLNDVADPAEQAAALLLATLTQPAT